MGFLSLIRRGRSKEKLAVVFDVSSGSVGGALISLAPGENPKIFYTTRLALPVKEAIDSKRFIEETFRALDLVAEDIRKHGFPHARFAILGGIPSASVFFFLASPWHVSQVRVLKKNEEEPFTVRREMVQELAEHEIEMFKKSQAAEYERRGMKKEELSILEQNIFDIRLNRYAVDDPFGKVGQEFTMTTYMSVAPQYIVDSLRDRADRFFGAHDAHIHSFMFAFFNIARDIWHAEDTFLLVDVSREVTDIGIVRDGRLFDMLSFPLGYGALFRDVARELKTSIEEAQSLVRLAIKKQISESQMSRVGEVLSASGKTWKDAFEAEVRNLYRKIPFSHRIMLTTHNVLSYWFKDLIESKEDGKGFLKETTSEVALLNSAVLSDFYSFKGRIEEDPFLAIETIFISKDKDIVSSR